MKRIILFFLSVGILVSCKRERILEIPAPVVHMDYIDLTGKAIGFNQSFFIDLNKDGRRDIGFGTVLVGDPVAKQDKWQYLVYSDLHSFLPIDADESIPMQNRNDRIPVEDFGNYNWYNAASILLAQKIVPVDGNEYWEGKWRNSTHNYLPVQIQQDGKRYNGWIELSFDIQSQKAIFYRAAISKDAESEVRAGV
jgi:hypothetical protein